MFTYTPGHESDREDSFETLSAPNATRRTRLVLLRAPNVCISVRLAFVSDIHANLSALEAVTVDLRTVSPDLVIHGGDQTC